MLKRLDTDQDGKISRAEFDKPMKKRFALLDLNDDGKVTKDEFALAHPDKSLHGHRHGRHHGQMDDQAPHHRGSAADPKPL